MHCTQFWKDCFGLQYLLDVYARHQLVNSVKGNGIETEQLNEYTIKNKDMSLLSLNKMVWICFILLLIPLNKVNAY